MLQLKVTSNIDELQKKLSDTAKKQMPFAMATALTSLAQLVAKAEKANEHEVLDRPRPFTTNSIKVIGARKDRLAALVYMQDIAARYLEPYEFGGTNVLNSKVLLKPIAAVKDLDQYGNLPRNFLAKIKGRSDIFVGAVKTKHGVIKGVWQRATEDGGKASTSRVGKDGKVKVRKTSKGLNTSGGLKLLVQFADAHPVKQRLHWFDLASKLVDDSVNQEFGKALGKALGTAKK